MDPFVHLHVHSDYSLLDGACDVTKLVARAKDLGMGAVALTDHGNLFGAYKFHAAARAAGIKPIIGCELYICQKDDHRAPPEGDSYNHLIVLCENEHGYRNLVKIVSEASLQGFYYKPRISKAFLAEHSQGLIGLSACLKGEVQELLGAGKPQDARRVAGQYGEIFGANRFFIEIQDQGLEQEHRIKDELLALSRSLALPLVATNDCHYLAHDDAQMHDVLLCIQMGKRVQDANRMRFGSDQFYLKSGAEMLRVFSGVEDAVHRTAQIAERCDFHLHKVENSFPDFAVPAGITLDDYFEQVTREGMARRESWIETRRQQGKTRYPAAAYRERLEREIAVIRGMRYSGYFLIVWDFIRFAREQGIPVGPGRGSAAGSLVSYALGITDLDPLENELLFERFLNTERISMPDIDVDFCMNRRSEVIDYVTRKYGRDNVSQIITFGTMAAKAAIKDVGRAMDLPYGEVDRIAKLVPNQLNITLAQALEQSPPLAELVDTDPKTAELIAVAQKVEGLCRHAGMHAAGVVIAPRPLTELVPLYKTNRDEIVTQFDMTGLEKLGLLKMDFLGLTTLTILDEAVKLIAEHAGVSLDLAHLPEDDAATFELFCKGQTFGVFQFESAGMRDILRRYRPNRLSDLTALNALYRPGPIQGGMIDDFIDRKLGRKPIAYALEELQPILEETFGVFVYQEQVMQAANVLAGYTLGQADILRKAMGKKNQQEMDRQRDSFLQGAGARGLPRAKVEAVFDLMAQFAGYGFNKSHAAAYGWVAFQTAYVKANYPVEFMAALLNASIASTDSLVKYIKECRSMRIPISAPDINVSGAGFTPQRDGIRFGLNAIKNVGETSVQTVLEARAAGPFCDLGDLCERVSGKALNKRVLESLIKAGALDGFGSRAALAAEAEAALERAQKAEKARQSGQHGLFLSFEEPASSSARRPLPQVADWDEATRLAHEKEVLGYYVSGHPLDRFADRCLDLQTIALEEIETRVRSRQEEIYVAGILSQVQTRKSKKGDLWASATVEDLTGRRELLCFSEAYRRLDAQLRATQPVLARVRVMMEDGHDEGEEGDGAGRTAKLQLLDLQDLASAPVTPPLGLRLRLALDTLEPPDLEQLASALDVPVGTVKLHLLAYSEREQFEQILEIGRGVNGDAALRRRLEAICGPGSVRVLEA
ncbi:MAG: DNA polymerase III subunit alpha [Acidobacteria bacterium]|nr:MAG: DNA polymerase III subunit alpha [Acidobacteriota bacterium]